MKRDNVTTREKKYEVVYKSYADDIYRLCLYFSKEEKQAANITQQVFIKFYKIYDKVHPDCILGHLVREAKGLLANSSNHEYTSEEVKQCATSGKK